MMKKFNQFCTDIYNPFVHFYFSLNWVLALFVGFSLNHQQTISFNPYLVVSIITLYLALLHLRVLDEVKDYEYDKIHNPERPLVRGSVQFKDLWLYSSIACMGFLCLNMLNGKMVLTILVIEILYSYLLISLEKKFDLIRENMLINLIFTYPVNVLLSVYAIVLFAHVSTTELHSNDYYLVTSFATAFLYYEFSRKITHPRFAKSGKKYYSDFFGFVPSLLISDFLGFISIGLMVYLTKSWLPLMLLSIQLLRLIKSKQKNLTLFGSAFIGFFYGLWMLIGLLTQFNFHFHFSVWP